VQCGSKIDNWWPLIPPPLGCRA